MFPSCNYVIYCFSFLALSFITCLADILPPAPPTLMLYSPGELEYVDVLVKREYDNLTLVCEMKGDILPRIYVWNYLSDNGTSLDRSFTVQHQGPSTSSRLLKPNLSVGDTGSYICSSPPFSVTKYILVQTKGPKHCARGAFWCGERCVLAMYVCDGRSDCLHGEDETPSLCGERPCSRGDRLNCSSGRCVPEAACCRPGARTSCRQPSCCDEHPRYSSRLDGYVDVEYPALFEDRHAPDDYGFIQSTIYTVTACALIFMIAVVLLVSAICKMHMKRAALRSYAHAERATRQHYSMQYERAHRFPPCYEASRLLEQQARGGGEAPSPAQSPGQSPTRQPAQQSSETAEGEASSENVERNAEDNRSNSSFGLSMLSTLFSSRYRQVPTQPSDVEMTDVRSTSLNSSPTRNQTRLDNYRSPTYCDLNTTDFYFTDPDTGNCGRDLNYMATPLELFRRRTLRSNLDRMMVQLDRQASRPLTLQLGRFQLSIPRFTRQSATEGRPDTPNVAEISIDDLDFVRLNSNDTYTLNGRTIRLLGANFENYPVLSDSAVRPPPYTEAMRYKLYGPPPEYLSRDNLSNGTANNGNEVTNNVDEDARNNVEMPPRYEDLAAGVDPTANTDNASNNISDTVTNNVRDNVNNVDSEACNNNEITTAQINNNVVNIESINSVIDNLPAIDSDVNANEFNSQPRNDNVNNAITVNNNE